MRHLPSIALATAVLLGGGTALAEAIPVKATPVFLNAEAPGEQRVGGLRYRGGLLLSSTDQRFGGLSALGVSADGRRMIALSDKGTSLAARLEYDGDGDLAGLADADLVPLTGPDGTALLGKFFTDAESMSPGVEGEIIVAFERDHRVWRYLPGELVPRPIPRPDELGAMPLNSGIEALTLLDDGRLLAIAEGLMTTTDSVAWVSETRGWSVLTYVAEDGFRPTGAATLPSGDVLVLERYFTVRGSNRARIKRVAVADVAPAARLTGTTVAEWGPPVTVDNFEGIEARRGPRGETLVYIVSDDNFNPEQKTYLLMFELVEG